MTDRFPMSMYANRADRDAAMLAELDRLRTYLDSAQRRAIERGNEVIQLREALFTHQVYIRALCRAVDAATDFAGTVAGGASWWDDVWAEHDAELDAARAALQGAKP